MNAVQGMIGIGIRGKILVPQIRIALRFLLKPLLNLVGSEIIPV